MTKIADKLQKIAEQTPKVYRAGYDVAMADGELAPQVPFFLSAFDATPWRAKYTASEGVFAEGGVVFNRFRGTMTSGQDGIMVSTIMPENSSNNDLAKNILGRYLIFRIRTNYSISGSTLRHFIQIQGDDSCEEGLYHAARVDIAPLKNGNWATYVIDITEACSRYVKGDGGYYPSIMHAGLAWYLRGVDHTTKYIDIAYSAVCETEDELLMLMRKETKFYHYDNSTNTWTQRSVADIITKTTHNCDYNDGFTAGKQAEYDAFWDAFQNYGNRIDYASAFGGVGWTQEMLENIKYPITFIAEAQSYACYTKGLFYYLNYGGNSPMDMTNILSKFDFSNCQRVSETFANAYVKNITLDLSNCDKLDRLFVCSDAGGKTCENVTLKVSAKCTKYPQTFYYCSGLTELRFMEGSVIAANIEFAQSKNLTRASIESIVAALSTTTNDLTCTFSKTAVFAVYNASDDDWGEFLDEVVMPHGNWNFSLV